MGSDAVPGGPDVRAVRWPCPRRRATAPRGPGLRAGSDEQIGVGPDADDDEYEVDVPTHRLAVGAGAVDVQPRGPVLVAADAGDGGRWCGG